MCVACGGLLQACSGPHGTPEDEEEAEALSDGYHDLATLLHFVGDWDESERLHRQVVMSQHRPAPSRQPECTVVMQAPVTE